MSRGAGSTTELSPTRCWWQSKRTVDSESQAGQWGSGGNTWNGRLISNSSDFQWRVWKLFMGCINHPAVVRQHENILDLAVCMYIQSAGRPSLAPGRNSTHTVMAIAQTSHTTSQTCPTTRLLSQSPWRSSSRLSTVRILTHTSMTRLLSHQLSVRTFSYWWSVIDRQLVWSQAGLSLPRLSLLRLNFDVVEPDLIVAA